MVCSIWTAVVFLKSCERATLHDTKKESFSFQERILTLCFEVALFNWRTKIENEILYPSIKKYLKFESFVLKTKLKDNANKEKLSNINPSKSKKRAC